MHELRVDPRINEQTDVSVKFQSSPVARSLEGRVYPFHSLDAIDDDDQEQSDLHEVGIRFHTRSNPQFDSWAKAVSTL